MKECVTKLYSSSYTKPIAKKKKIEFNNLSIKSTSVGLLLSRHT